MPLKIKLKPQERLIVNGCIIQNDDRRSMLTVHNMAQIIRSGDILRRDEADTAVKGVYYMIQMLLVGSDDPDATLKSAHDGIANLYKIIKNESIRGYLMEAGNHLSAGDCYKALRSMKPVIDYEADLMKTVSPKNEIE